MQQRRKWTFTFHVWRVGCRYGLCASKRRRQFRFYFSCRRLIYLYYYISSSFDDELSVRSWLIWQASGSCQANNVIAWSPDITYFDRTAARGSVQNTMEKSESDGRMHNLNWSFRNKGKRLLCSMKSEYGNRFLLNRLIFSQKSVCTAEFAIFARICSSRILLWSRKCLSSSTHHHYHTQMKHARA